MERFPTFLGLCVLSLTACSRSQVQPSQNAPTRIEAKHDLPIAPIDGLSQSQSTALVTFEAFMVTDRPMFKLSTQGGTMSDWISLGEEFEGVALVDFDPIGDVLTIDDHGERRMLPLRESQVREGATADPEARLRSLSGLDLAYELAVDDSQLMYLVGRYHGALEGLATGRTSQSKVDSEKSDLINAAEEKAAKILVEK